MYLIYKNSNTFFKVGYCKMNDNVIKIFPCTTDFKIKNTGFKIYCSDNDESDLSIDCSDFRTLYKSENGQIFFSNDESTYTEENDPERYNKIMSEINKLKESLAKSDYKVIKNYEATMAGLEPPYDPKELHDSREAARVKCNELEEMAEGLKNKTVNYTNYF